MPTGYSRSPRLLKGALIHFSAPMLIPVPNVIIFQYNPDTMTRNLTPWSPAQRQVTYDDKGNVKEDKLSAEQLNQLSQPFDPQETFSLVLEVDATDALEFPDKNPPPVAVVAGVADRIAAMEMLCYPPGPSALGGLLNVPVSVSIGGDGISFGGSAAADVVPRTNVPIVLFFWGPGRIVPVRITSLSIDEQEFSPLLYPIKAKITLGLKVLDEDQLLNLQGKTSDSATVEIAKACYKFTRAQKEALALANYANDVESIIGMLPT